MKCKRRNRFIVKAIIYSDVSDKFSKEAIEQHLKKIQKTAGDYNMMITRVVIDCWKERNHFTKRH